MFYCHRCVGPSAVTAWSEMCFHDSGGGGGHKSTHLIPQMSSLLIFHFHLNRVFLIYLFFYPQRRTRCTSRPVPPSKHTSYLCDCGELLQMAFLVFALFNSRICALIISRKCNQAISRGRTFGKKPLELIFSHVSLCVCLIPSRG